MKAHQLKNAILQLAVQGKLVPQNPNDEPASKLLQRIAAEKRRRIKAGEIKKDKRDSTIIRRGASFYEIANTTERCIDDELPFDLPKGWEWARLANVVYNRGQCTPHTDFCYIDIGSINNINQTLNSNETIISPKAAPSRARKLVCYGDILYATVRPYLHNMCIIDKEFSHPPIASTGFAVLTCCNDLFNKFLFYYLLSPIFDSYANDLENSKGVAYPSINDGKLYKALIPIPPPSRATPHRRSARVLITARRSLWQSRGRAQRTRCAIPRYVEKIDTPRRRPRKTRPTKPKRRTRQRSAGTHPCRETAAHQGRQNQKGQARICHF